MRYFLFTEAINCGKVLRPCLESFNRCHPQEKLHIYGTSSDLKSIQDVIAPNNEFINVDDDKELLRAYQYGHLGTARLFATVLTQAKNFGYSHVLHIDSDLFFREPAIHLLTNNLEYDLVGSRRCYKHNTNNRNDLRHLPDVIQTYFCAVKLPKKLPEFDELIYMCQAVGYNVLDFFDPMSFYILNAGGTVKFLDFNEVGGFNEEGSRINVEPRLNHDMDAGSLMIHFAGVGSGWAFIKRGNVTEVPQSYVDWAKKRYLTFAKVFYDENTFVGLDQNLISELGIVVNEHKLIEIYNKEVNIESGC